MAYTIGPALHNPAECAHQQRAANDEKSLAPASLSGVACTHTHNHTAPEDAIGDASVCPFCRILSVPYREATTTVQAPAAVTLATVQPAWRLSPGFAHYHGFSFGARAPPAG